MERARLVDYLNNGGRVYIEGCDFASDNDTTALYRMLGSLFAGDGGLDVTAVTGQEGTITAGLGLDYLSDLEWGWKVDFIEPDGGTTIFRCGGGFDRAVVCSGPAGNYRAIQSCFIFGQLRDGADTKAGLMAAFLKYFFSD